MGLIAWARGLKPKAPSVSWDQDTVIYSCPYCGKEDRHSVPNEGDYSDIFEISWAPMQAMTSLDGKTIHCDKCLAPVTFRLVYEPVIPRLVARRAEGNELNTEGGPTP